MRLNLHVKVVKKNIVLQNNLAVFRALVIRKNNLFRNKTQSRNKISSFVLIAEQSYWRKTISAKHVVRNKSENKDNP